MNSSCVRRLSLVGALVGSVGAAGLVAGATAAGATTGVVANRLAGATRYATSAVIAQSAFPSGSTTAVLASGEDFPDALTAAYLAGHLHAPVLLTPTAALDPATLSGLKALGVKGVDIVGGTAAVSQNVTTQLETDGYTVSHTAGINRFATAAAVAQEGGPNFVGTLGTLGRTAIVASGLTFPDALAGSAMAYSQSFPILLTQPGSLSPETAAALVSLQIAHVLVLGGTAAVSSAVENQIIAAGMTVVRVAGIDRTQTATAIATLETAQLSYSTTTVDLARGDIYPDALSGGPYSGESSRKAPILLSDSPDTLGQYTTAYLRTNAASITTINIFGGTSAITSATQTAAITAAGG